MRAKWRLFFGIAVACLLAASTPPLAASTALKILPGHLPNLPSSLVPTGQLPTTNQVRLALGLPVRNEQALDDLLAQVSDPASPNYGQYLTPEEFTVRFGPTVEDYQAALDFARTNGLAVTATHSNRLLLDVMGAVKDIQSAFHITLLTYRHPSEAREFFVPNTEPSVDARLPVSDVSGLNNYTLPHPKSHKLNPSVLGVRATPRTGSSPTGAYLGNDFRAAYLPGVTLTGVGQMVGLVQFDGFYGSDITAYEMAAGLPKVPVQTVLLDGYNGTPGSGNNEVCLDIEMAMAMAPGLSKIIVFEAGPSGIANDILNAMAASNQVKQFSCSWGWGGGPSTTTDAIFKQMAAQGQSFFSASGDSDAFTAGATSANGVDNPSLNNAPSSCPYITMVGGTTLSTTGPGGAWSSEKVWNWGSQNGSYVGSSGGISSYYSIPSWQTGLSMSANGGSSSYRNIPDVALVADNVYVTDGNGSTEVLGGTSCAAPLWAGLAALINQQAVAAGKPTIGFVNPALYALGKGAGFASAFHDITTGNNVSGDSPNLFYATTGYDLCTGWGTPAGQALIDSLAGTANPLAVIPSTGFTSTGPVGGPFSPTSETLLLTNSGTNSLTWSLVNTSAWLTVSSTNGTLAARTTALLSASLASPAYRLTPGIYSAALVVTNYSGGAFPVIITLSIGQSVVQNGGFETGDFTGWTLVGNTTDAKNVYNAVENLSSGFAVAHSGTFGAFLGDTQVASLSQSIPTVPGQYYLLSFWLQNPTNGTVQQFTLNWNTNSTSKNPIYSILNPPAFSWTNVHFLLSAASTNTTLEFQAENDPNYFALDDVSLVPIPLPVFQTAGPSGNNFALSWVTTTGLTYQVQYKTNLLQTNWNSLTTAFQATNSSLNLVDTNSGSSSPQRFYRLLVSP